MAQSNQSVLYDINLKYTCIMVESHRAQQYMMVSFNFDLSKIGFLHYIRNVVRHKILGLGKTRPGYMYIESIQPIGINEIIADIKLIPATYLIFAVAVKSES